MAFTNIERVYFNHYAEKFKTKELSVIRENLRELAIQLTSTRPTNRVGISEIVREMLLQGHYMGLLEMYNAQQASILEDTEKPSDNLALIVTSLEDISDGARYSLPYRLIKALGKTNITHTVYYNCDAQYKPELNVYVAVIDAQPGSELHKHLLDNARDLNIDIRVTSTKWFD